MPFACGQAGVIVPQVTEQVSPDQLWGTTISAVRLDLPAGRVELDVTATRGNADPVLYRVTFDRVRRVSLTHEVPVPWTYVELTEWHDQPTEAGVRVVLVLWTEPTGIEIVCRAFSITVR